eukprot:1026259-Prorocentrum_lima.AAC.1
MTSSLVGSEMCIRDSPETGQAGAQEHPILSHEAGVAGQEPHARGPTHFNTCLLYTSDAADDM